jgi:5-formyltetrahydrofolate cyclo-ligase
MAEPGTREEKRALRRGLLAERRGLPAAELAATSRAIVTTLRTLPELTAARDVLLYAADPDEVDLDALLLDPPSGWRVLLPRVEEGGLVAVPHPPGAPLVIGTFGIREPVGDPVDPALIDAVVVPGVAFTPAGVRLGRGAGLYDRLLPRLRTGASGGALSVGVCAERFVRAVLPGEAHDARVDLVVTDASVRRRGGPGSTGAA